jgi:hypothetical protein
MLRGSCSCAISERPTHSLFAVPSLFRMLSPIIPVHPRHSPVSPIIPVHTQKQGGGVCYLCGHVSQICRRADIFGHDVLQGTADANSAYRAPTGGEKNQPEGWPLQGRGGKRQRRKKRHSGEWRSQAVIFWREVVAGSFGRRATRTRGRPIGCDAR